MDNSSKKITLWKKNIRTIFVENSKIYNFAVRFILVKLTYCLRENPKNLKFWSLTPNNFCTTQYLAFISFVRIIYWHFKCLYWPDQFRFFFSWSRVKVCCILVPCPLSEHILATSTPRRTVIDDKRSGLRVHN